tara:strand:- start:597 stop:821 length:225 start_codon:yes stop_codon:yes gene_type:complete
MALVKELERIQLDRNSVHEGTTATFCVFTDSMGQKYIQIDTYGSKTRKIPGKKSQSIQFGPEGIANLKEILSQF